MSKLLSSTRLIALLLSLGLLLPSLYLGKHLLQTQQAMYMTELQSDQQRMLNALNYAVQDKLEHHDSAGLHAMLEAISSDEKLSKLQLILHSGAAQQDAASFQFQSKATHLKGIELTHQVYVQGQLVGDLILGVSTAPLAQQMEQAYLNFLAIMVLQFMLCGGLILYILERRFTRPLQRLYQDMQSLENLEQTPGHTWRQEDEVGRVGWQAGRARQHVLQTIAELQENEQKFRRLTRLSSDWYWERDKQDRLITMSAGFAEISGVDPQTLLGNVRGNLLNIEYDPAQWKMFQECVARRLPFDRLEWCIYRADGEVRYGLSRGEPVYSANGEFCGYRGVGKDITAEKLAEKAQKSTARFKAMVEHLPAGAIYLEDEHLLMNQAAEELTGYTRAEVSNRQHWFGHLFARDSEQAQRQYENDRQAGFPLPRQLEIQRKDGQLRVVEFSAFVDDYSEVWLLHDITRQKQVEEDLNRTLQELNAIFNNTNAGIEYVVNRTIVRCNRGFEEMFGYEPGELNGKSTRIYYLSDEDWTEHARMIYPRDVKSDFVTTEWQYRKKDGSTIWCTTNAKMIDAKDFSKGAIAVSFDITAKKLAEAAFQQSYQEQQVIFENASVGIALLKDRVIQRCNRSLEIMLGYQNGELLGLSARVLFPSAHSWEQFEQLADPTIRAGNSWSGEWELRMKDGSQFWYSAQGKLVDVLHPEKGAIWVAHDMSERKRTEAMLLETKHRLETSLLEKERTFQEVILLSELSSFLQACPNLTEAFAGLREFGPRIFPDSAGALYLLEESSDTLVEQVSWGTLNGHTQSFVSNQCWALRRGQTYRMDQPTRALCCPHLLTDQGVQRPYTCLPLVSLGVTFGLLFAEYCYEAATDQNNIRHRLLVAFAEQTGLALANMRLRDTLRQQSILDPLTGLFNRRHLNQVLQSHLLTSQRQSLEFAIAILDVDRFKQFNENFGHDAGDHVLQEVAQALLEKSTEQDMVCRYGGEEFVILINHLDMTQLDIRIAQYLEAIRALNLRHTDRALGRITASLGLARYPQDGSSVAALLEAAGAALYRAKRNGRDRAVYSDSSADIKLQTD